MDRGHRSGGALVDGLEIFSFGRCDGAAAAAATGSGNDYGKLQKKAI